MSLNFFLRFRSFFFGSEDSADAAVLEGADVVVVVELFVSEN
jgi:hypothetical protein